MVTLQIDGRTVQAPEGTTILEAAPTGKRMTLPMSAHANIVLQVMLVIIRTTSHMIVIAADRITFRFPILEK